MDTQKQKNNELIIGKLFSNNPSVVLETLETIRTKGNSELIPALAELMLASDQAEVRQQIRTIFADLKDPQAVDPMVQCILNEHFLPIRQELISLCWENGLNYLPYLGTFVDLVINGNYMEAFEAMTVIENLEGSVSKEAAEPVLGQLKRVSATLSGEKAGYVHELLALIPQLIKE